MLKRSDGLGSVGGYSSLLPEAGLYTVEPNYVYRALRPDEVVAIEAGGGIIRGTGRTTANQHVLGVVHHHDPWVSTTRSYKSAVFFATGGGKYPANPIILIDLNKVAYPVYDVSTKEAAMGFLTHPRAINFAAGHEEVLIHGGVNPEAIIIP